LEGNSNDLLESVAALAQRDENTELSFSIAISTPDIRKQGLHITSQLRFRYFNSTTCRNFRYETVKEEQNLEQNL
jgi:hypothetical protein